MIKANSSNKYPWGNNKAASSVVPLSFLRSTNSFGIGNILDLKYYLQLAHERGEKVVQILPINDSGAQNLWPYSAISSFAINPIYISVLDLLNNYQDKLTLETKGKTLQLLNHAQKEEKKASINYLVVRNNLLKVLKLLFKELFDQNLIDLEPFKKEQNWVIDYALFCVISDKHKQKSWSDWDNQELKNHEKTSLEKFYAKHHEEVNFYIFCQKIALRQLREVHTFANQQNILLKGDIPILVDRNSADVWANPEFFHLDYGAGAPPDAFSIGGQEWGSPPLKWDLPAAQNYFISRFKFGQNYMDMVRIDHVLGLFRLMIWHKAKGNLANNGFFYPQINSAVNVAITRQELENIGIAVNFCCKKTGVITDAPVLGNLAEKCVELGLAKWIENHNQIAWLTDKKLNLTDKVTFEDYAHYANNLDFSDDDIFAILKDSGFNEADAWQIIIQRRRLQNMLGSYFADQDNFFFTIYGKETWHYLNLSTEQQQALDQLLREKEAQQYAFWQENGKNILTQLQQQTSLFLCAEDLGKVDPYIPLVLAELNIPGINIIRWSPSFKKADQRELAVLATSSHDTSTLAQWWEEPSTSPETKQRFFHEFYDETQTAPEHLSKAQLQDIFLTIYQAKSILVSQTFWEILNVFYNETDKRINIPGISDHNNWCARMEKPLENYLAEKKVSKHFMNTISHAQRTN